MLTLILLLPGVAQAAAASAPAGSRPVWETSELGQTMIMPMRSAPFPHESRTEGFRKGNDFYPREPHYTDGSVAIFIPRTYRRSDRVDLLVYFHGHNNNLRKAMEQFKLREQVLAGGRNVIFVFPQGPKDAGDSGGGRLEEPDGLKHLVAEVMDTLLAQGKVPSSARLGRVLLAGHSGAYRVISFCLERGGLPDNITSAGLLDASYDRLDAFVNWAADKSARQTRRFFSIFTDHLAGENVYMMTHLRAAGVSYELAAEQDATDAVLRGTRVLFLHAEKLTHDQTVQWLQRWLAAQPTRPQD